MEPRETATFVLDDLLSGGTGVVSQVQWFAHAPQVDEPVSLEEADVLLLGRMSPTDWVDDGPLRKEHGAGRLRVLLKFGLLIGASRTWQVQREADDLLREQHWFGLSAISHARSRWVGLDAAREVVEAGMNTAAGLRNRYGAPPPMVHERGMASSRIALPRVPHTALDALFDRRSTCRNFDRTAMLSIAQFSHVVDRVFGARGQVHGADDFDMIKRTSPSGGAMHATDAYFVVHRVEGLAPGLYHYNAIEHALQPMTWQGTPDELEAFAR
jgi:putative peptide maturation dehydrogenase